MSHHEEEIARLRQRIAELEKAQAVPVALTPEDSTPPFVPVDKLSNEEIYRFGRQLVTVGFGYECKFDS